MVLGICRLPQSLWRADRNSGSHLNETGLWMRIEVVYTLLIFNHWKDIRNHCFGCGGGLHLSFNVYNNVNVYNERKITTANADL